METVRFNKSGGPITVAITSGYAQPGSYYFILWEANSNRVVTEKKGNFINTEDDSYILPDPAVKNDGRLIDFGIKLTIIPPENQYNIEVSVTQDGNQIGNATQTGTSSNKCENIQIFIQLKGGE